MNTVKMKQEIRPTNFSEQETLRWIVGALLTTLSAVLIFIKNHLVNLFKNRNDNIEKRLVSIEKEQVELMLKVRSISHKLDNRSVAESSILMEMMERLVDLKTQSDEFKKILDREHG